VLFESDPPGKLEVKEQLVTVIREGDERGRRQLAIVGETVTRQTGMEKLP